MAKIPVYEQTQTLPGKSGAVETPFAMDDVGKALGEVGKRMYWLSSDLKQAALKEKQEREMAEFAYSRASLLKAWGESYAELQENGDFNTMPEAWAKAKQKAYDMVRSGITMDDARKEFDIWATEAGVRMDLDVANLVVQRRRDDTRAKISFAIEEAIKSGNMEEVKMLLSNTTAYTEQEKAKLLMSAGKDIEIREVKAGLRLDPFNYEIPDVSQFEYLDAKDLDALRQDQMSEQNFIKAQRAQEEEAIVGDILDKYHSTGKLPSMSQLLALHEADPETGMRKISNSTFNTFAALIKSTNKVGGPPKPTVSTEQTIANFNTLMGRVNSPEEGSLYSLKLEIKTAQAQGLITSDEESVLNEILNKRISAEDDLDLKVLQAEEKVFSETLSGVDKYFDIATIGNMKREFWTKGSILSASGKLSNTDAKKIGMEVLRDNIHKMNITGTNLPRTFREAAEEYLEDAGFTAEVATKTVLGWFKSPDAENPSAPYLSPYLNIPQIGSK